jgi:hypothetical protein
MLPPSTHLGGKLVLGSGNCWPQDFLFFTGFFSGAGVPATLPSVDPPNTLSALYDCGVMTSLGSMVLSKSDGYCVLGLETKLSAGECSTLMRGVDMVKRVSEC